MQNGPFSLHIPLSWGPLGKLQQLMNMTPTGFLFCTATDMIIKDKHGLSQIKPNERARMTKQIGQILHKLDPALQVWSCRRGGLQRLATLGLDLAQIREHFSHHKDEKQLGEYLETFKYSNAQAKLHAEAAEQV